MSLDQNRADLARHADDFAARTGFTYTVLAVRTEEVIGCVYIYPAKEGLGAEVRSWVRVRDADLDRALFDAVSAWLARDWPFESVAYAARPADRPA
jgi:hypothetical protein